MSRSEPTPLRFGLDAVVGALRGGGDAQEVRGIFGTWDDAVGPLVAANVRPVRFEAGVLHVEVAEPAWATQIRFLDAEIRTALAERGGVRVERMEVRVAGARGRSSVGGRATVRHRK